MYQAVQPFVTAGNQALPFRPSAFSAFLPFCRFSDKHLLQQPLLIPLRPLDLRRDTFYFGIDAGKEGGDFLLFIH